MPTTDSPSAQQSLRYDVADGVATITLNMEERKNALSAALVEGLAELLERANGDDGARLISLTNTGNTFCAGADLKSDTPGVADSASTPGGQEHRTFVDVFKMMRAAPKPIIGRIDGHAMGGGVGLVAACDISIMRDDAKIGFTEVRLGVAPAVISVVCLPKIRQADAAELFLTGERFTPRRAVEIGLINRAVPADELDDQVNAFADMIIRGGPAALAAAKDLVYRVNELDSETAFDWTTDLSRQLFRSEEAQAGIAAFRHREPAPWVPATASTEHDIGGRSDG